MKSLIVVCEKMEGEGADEAVALALEQRDREQSHR